jgi:hypothetical protein
MAKRFRGRVATRRGMRLFDKAKYDEKLKRVRKLGVYLSDSYPLGIKYSWGYFFLELCELIEAGTNKIKMGNVYMDKKLVMKLFPYSEVYYARMMKFMLLKGILIEFVEFDRVGFYIINPDVAYKKPKPEGLSVLFTRDFDDRIHGSYYARRDKDKL